MHTSTSPSHRIVTQIPWLCVLLRHKHVSLSVTPLSFAQTCLSFCHAFILLTNMSFFLSRLHPPHKHVSFAVTPLSFSQTCLSFCHTSHASHNHISPHTSHSHARLFPLTNYLFFCVHVEGWPGRRGHERDRAGEGNVENLFGLSRVSLSASRLDESVETGR